MAHEDPGAYLPIDRRHALARGEGLPEHTSGAALFADVAGFTPLTEALVRALGPRRGAEELSRQLNLVFDALVAEAHRYGGSVVSFGGDALTCWFAEGEPEAGRPGDQEAGAGAARPERHGAAPGPPAASAARRAVACGLAMQGALARVGAVLLPTGGRVNLAMKVAVAGGPARRLVVGDPALRQIDVLAGATLARMAAAEQLAHRAEVVLSPECADALGDDALVLEWREGPAGRYPVVGGLMAPAPPAPWPPPPPAPAERLRPWLLPALHAQLAAGRAVQPELRPAAALFASFASLDYDGDPGAPALLDAFVCWAQRALDRHGGHMLQLTIGDKGSYFYAIFGAPVAHERSALMAALAALELRQPPEELAALGPLRVGISEGTVWAGAYGGAACRAYGVLGDEVNLAARLMQRAGPGEILASEPARRAVAGAVECEPLAPLDLKGKSRPVTAARLLRPWPAAAGAPEAAGPLVGPAAELAWLRERMAPILAGRPAGVVTVYGEPGIGKSRLVEALREELAPPPGAAGDGAATAPRVTWLACQGEQLPRPPLHPFRLLLRRHFGLPPAAEPLEPAAAAEHAARLGAALDALLADLDAAGAAGLRAELERARPFLAALAGLPADDRRLERTEPERRLAATLAAVVALVRAESARRPTVLQVEDAGWLDGDSLALVGQIAREGAGQALAVLVTARPGAGGAAPELPLDPATPRATLELGGLDAVAVVELAAATLGAAVEGVAGTFLAARSGGNPLFVEQLALDMRERGALRAGAGARGQEAGQPQTPLLAADAPPDEVPASLTAVLIARLDRLPPAAKAAVQAAAVLGQEFELAVLAALGDGGAATELAAREAAAHGIWAPAGEGRYSFRHALMRDAAYQMQPHARLRELHDRAVLAIERRAGEGLAPYVADLARHAELAGDAQRQRRYLALLGEQAFNLSAFAEAAACYERALALAPGEATAEQGRLLARLARARAFLGDAEGAGRLYEQGLALAEAAGDRRLSADSSYELGALAQRAGALGRARPLLEGALAAYTALDDRAAQARTLNRLGALLIELDDAEGALKCYQRALDLGRRRG